MATLSLVALTAAGQDQPGDRDFVILDGKLANELLTQCSRSSPGPGDGVWAPREADIQRLETALPDALARLDRSDRDEFIHAPTGWVRQYVGIVRNGRRSIYGNFVAKFVIRPPIRTPRDDWHLTPQIVCDGGAAFFGVEFDLESGTFTHIAFNGSID